MRNEYVTLALAILIASLGCLSSQSASLDDGYAGREPAATSAPYEMVERQYAAPSSGLKGLSDIQLASEGAPEPSSEERVFLASPSENGGETIEVPEIEHFDEGEADVIGVKIIYSGNVDIEVEDFDTAYTQVKSMVEGYDGYVSDSNVYTTPAGKKRGVITVRVPKEKFQKVIDGVSDLGTVKTLTTSAQDVTLEYTDLSSRLKNLKTQEDRLLELLDMAVNVSDLLTIEKELERIRENIEIIQGRLNYLDNKVGFSTLTIVLHEPEPIETEPITFEADVEVENIEEVLERIDVMAKEAGGYIFNAWVDESDPTKKKAGIQIDLPQDRYTSLHDKLKGIGKFENQRVEGFPQEDISAASRATINLRITEKTSLIRQVIDKDYGLGKSIHRAITQFVWTIKSFIESTGTLLPIAILAAIGHVVLRRSAKYKNYFVGYLFILSILTAESGGWIIIPLLIIYFLGKKYFSEK
jgi:hypothetical protein